MTLQRIALVVSLLLAGVSCKKEAGKDGWLAGNTSERFETIAGQLRGFDVAMVETGYRYQELYWAGQDENWQYAEYQTAKIRTAISRGLERRPKRAASAQPFLTTTLPAMAEAAASKDAESFNASFALLTQGCNSCHELELVPFFRVAPPVGRSSPIQ